MGHSQFISGCYRSFPAGHRVSQEGRLDFFV